METPIIVLRTSVLFLVAFMLVLWQYVSHTTRLAAAACSAPGQDGPLITTGRC